MADPKQDEQPLREISPTPPWSSFPILSKETLVPEDPERGIHPIRRFTFGYPENKSLSFTFTTQVLKIVRSDTGVHKSYSPTSESDEQGKFELVIRIYPGGGHSEWLDAQPIGTPITMFGPLPPPKFAKIKVYSPGKRVVAIALGIGITEVYTTCREELRKNNETKVSLIHSVRYRDEIVLKDEIQELVSQFQDRFNVTYITTGEEVSEKGWLSGRINANVVNTIIGDVPKEDTRILVVGTKQMIRTMWKELETIGFDYESFSLVRKRSPLALLPSCTIV